MEETWRRETAVARGEESVKGDEGEREEEKERLEEVQVVHKMVTTDKQSYGQNHRLRTHGTGLETT